MAHGGEGRRCAGFYPRRQTALQQRQRLEANRLQHRRLEVGQLPDFWVGRSRPEEGSELNALFEIDEYSGELGANPNAERFGLYVPYNILQELWTSRKKYSGKGTDGLGGLYSLYGLLGPAFDILAPTLEEIQDQDLEDLEDVNGLEGLGAEFAGPDFELTGINGLHGSIEALENIGSEKLGADEELLYFVDGLGRARRGRGRRGRRGRRRRRRGRGGRSSAAPQPVKAEPKAEPTSKSQGSDKHLGLYVPLNTLKNLLKVRGQAVQKLQSKGNVVSPGIVPTTVDGMAVSGSCRFPGPERPFRQMAQEDGQESGRQRGRPGAQEPGLGEHGAGRRCCGRSGC